MESTCSLNPPYIKDGFVQVDGIKIGKIRNCNGEAVLEVCDKDHRRADERGTRFVVVRITDILRLFESEPPPAELRSLDEISSC